MKIVCERNGGEDLPKWLQNEAMMLTGSTRFAVTVGSAYVVYAMTLFLGDVWYYICDNHYGPLYYPVWYPASLFRVVDPHISTTWQYAYDPAADSSDEAMLFAFREWATDRRFYERLTDGEPGAVETFRRYKKLLDGEFA